MSIDPQTADDLMGQAPFKRQIVNGRSTLLATLIVLTPALVWAHVTVRPRESKTSALEHYTVRVPTEGAVSTTSLELEIPAGVTVTEVPSPRQATSDTKRVNGRIVAIVWTQEIPPKEAAEFVFTARNPSAGTEIAWKAHQRFADGTTVDWIGSPGGKRPASVTRLMPASASR